MSWVEVGAWFSNTHLCLKPQKNCERTLNRFTRKHNSILSSLCIHLSKKVCPGFKIFANIKNYENPENLCKAQGSDIVIKEKDSIRAIEAYIIRFRFQKYKRNENFTRKIKFR